MPFVMQRYLWSCGKSSFFIQGCTNEWRFVLSSDCSAPSASAPRYCREWVCAGLQRMWCLHVSVYDLARLWTEILLPLLRKAHWRYHLCFVLFRPLPEIPLFSSFSLCKPLTVWSLFCTLPSLSQCRGSIISPLMVMAGGWTVITSPSSLLGHMISWSYTRSELNQTCRLMTVWTACACVCARLRVYV